MLTAGEVTVGKNSPGWERPRAPGVGSLGLCAGGEYPHPLAQQLSLLSSVFSRALVTGCTCSFCPLPLPATAWTPRMQCLVCSLLYPGILAVKDWHIVGTQPKRLNEWELKVPWEHRRGSSALAWVEWGRAEMALLMLDLEEWVRVCQLLTRLQRSNSARGAEV